ncbi:exosortase [Alteromonas macleodii]
MHSRFWTLIAITGIWCVANYPIIESLWVYSFDDGTYSHAYLVPFIVIYLFYILEQENRISYRKQPSIKWSMLAIVVGFGLVLATWSQITLLYWAASLLSLFALVFCIFRFNVSTFFPFAFLVFIFPFWGALASPLQSLSVYVVSALMSLTSIPVYVENEFVTIPAGVFEIAEGCSGLRYVIVSAAISSLYVFLYLKTMRSALIFTLVALVGALVTNWLRIVALIVIGHETEMQSSLMTDHNNFGWYIYIPVAIFQFHIGRKLEDRDSGILEINEKVIEPHSSLFSLKIAVVTAIIGVILSSSVAMSSAQHNSQDTCASQPLPISPEIHNADLVCTEKSNDVVSANFYFYGTSFDSKASYYLNSPLPLGFTTLKVTKSENWNLIEAKNNKGEMFVIAYRYGTDFGHYLSSLSLKKARLLNAFSANTSSNIQWKLTRCNNACNQMDLERVSL